MDWRWVSCAFDNSVFSCRCGTSWAPGEGVTAQISPVSNPGIFLKHIAPRGQPSLGLSELLQKVQPDEKVEGRILDGQEHDGLCLSVVSKAYCLALKSHAS
eukprot:m.231606 g.231606  ORF g.231606 m.231606 type:complete len:101 (+) comp54278_c1_seq14:1690-1992(+)